MGGGRQIHLQAGDEIVLDAGVSLTLQAGGHCLRIDPSGIYSSVKVKTGAAPGVVEPITDQSLATAPSTGPAPATFPSPESYLQALESGALQVTSHCEFEANESCALHPDR
ncbi:hypothetical protein D3C78_1519920 [compost metagenome]